MDMFEEARAISGTLKLCRITQAELAKRMGVSQSYIANKLRLLGFSEPLVEEIRRSGISERHARTLLRLDGEVERLDVLRKIVARHLTVRECEAIVDTMVDSYAPKIIERAKSLEKIDSFKETLKRSVETLKSFGIDAKARTSYEEGNMYITVCISNA